MLVRTWLSFESREKLKALSKAIGIDQYKLIDLMLEYIIENELMNDVLRRVKPEKKVKQKKVEVEVKEDEIKLPDYIIKNL